MKNILSVLAILFLLSAPNVLAQDLCHGDFDFDGDVDAEDLQVFILHFGREPSYIPCPADGPSGVPKTGQTTSYATADDGQLEKGVAWPNPRFTINDGTVTDNLTGLIWLRDANCFGQTQWNQALSHSNGLKDGQCGLTDGSSVGDWRLPNRNELYSLVHHGYWNPALPDTAGAGQWTNGDPFYNVVISDWYYTSTTCIPCAPGSVWRMYFQWGIVDYQGVKTQTNYVWPVRGGH